jgi:hypothetical protein
MDPRVWMPAHAAAPDALRASSCFIFWETCASCCCCAPTPPAAAAAATCERGNTARVPQYEESTACVPQCERERDHIAHVLMRERRERKHIACALMRETGREHSADAMCWVGACSTVRTTPGGVGAPVAVRVCTGVRARGEQHLLQHTETRWNN